MKDLKLKKKSDYELFIKQKIKQQKIKQQKQKRPGPQFYDKSRVKESLPGIFLHQDSIKKKIIENKDIISKVFFPPGEFRIDVSQPALPEYENITRDDIEIYKKLESDDHDN